MEHIAKATIQSLDDLAAFTARTDFQKWATNEWNRFEDMVPKDDLKDFQGKLQTFHESWPEIKNHMKSHQREDTTLLRQFGETWGMVSTILCPSMESKIEMDKEGADAYCLLLENLILWQEMLQKDVESWSDHEVERYRSLWNQHHPDVAKALAKVERTQINKDFVKERILEWRKTMNTRRDANL